VTAEPIHPAATQHLPSFVTAPGGTDVLMIVTAVILLIAVVGFGVLFLRLHTLPERMAHKSHKLQFEIVAVLGLIALFTHMHIFWVAGLLLALIDFPDFGGWFSRITRATEKIAGIKNEDLVEGPEVEGADIKPGESSAKPAQENVAKLKRTDASARPASAKPHEELTRV
jgi:hypothetical protein